MEIAIRTKGLTKLYGRTIGVVDIDLEVPAGEVMGFLGPNGAGKTTTIRLLMDLIRPDSGSVEVLGRDVGSHSEEIRRHVGFLPGDLALYRRMSARQHFELFAHLRGDAGTDRALELAARLDLDVDRPSGQLSTGNRQKVGIVQALMSRPSLLILDEPTAGLDPLMQREFATLLRETTAEGGTVFLSSHSLDEVERVADRVTIIRGGRIATTDDVALLKQTALTRLDIRFHHPVPEEAFRGVLGVEDITVDGDRLDCTVVGSVDDLLRRATRYEVRALHSHEADLEDVFMRYFGEASGVS